MGVKYIARTVGIGIQTFSEIIENNYFYVDKTSFIKEWWESGDSEVLTDKDREYFDRISIDMKESDATSAIHP